MEANLPLVMVAWNDANFDHDTAVTLETVGDLHKPTVVTTLGWVLRHDTVGITLVNEFFDSTYRGRTFIHAPMIISVTPFNLVKPRKRQAPPAASGHPTPI